MIDECKTKPNIQVEDYINYEGESTYLGSKAKLHSIDGNLRIEFSYSVTVMG